MHTKITNTLGEVRESNLDQALSKYEGQQVQLQWLGAAGEVFRQETCDVARARELITQSVGLGQTAFRISPAAFRAPLTTRMATRDSSVPGVPPARVPREAARADIVHTWMMMFSVACSGGNCAWLFSGFLFFEGTRDQALLKLKEETCARGKDYGGRNNLSDWIASGQASMLSPVDKFDKSPSEPVLKVKCSAGFIGAGESEVATRPFTP